MLVQDNGLGRDQVVGNACGTRRIGTISSRLNLWECFDWLTLRDKGPFGGRHVRIIYHRVNIGQFGAGKDGPTSEYAKKNRNAEC